MKLPKLIPSLALLALAAPSLPAEPAAGPSPAETKLREALRATTVRLRSVEGELAAAQSSVEAKDKEIAAAKKKYDALAARTGEEIALGSKHMAALNEKISKQDARIKNLSDSLDRSSADGVRLADKLRSVEAERARLKTLSDRESLRAGQRESQNIELFRLGNEILTRYADFSLGRAITNREPFVGLARVELQTQIQDYADKIADLKARADAETQTAAR